MRNLGVVFKAGSGYKALLVSILATSLGYGLYKGILDNYLAQIVTMNEFDRGLTEFFREMPGLLLVFILAALYTFSAERLYKIGSLIMLGGMVMISAVPPEKALVTMAVSLYSLGEHIQLGMKSTLTLGYALPGRGGEALGVQSAVNQIGSLAGLIVIIVAFLFVPEGSSFRIFFWFASLITLGSVATAMRLKGSSRTDPHRKRFYFRKKYTKYYMLEIFYGARKQVFFTFGPYVLILFYGARTAAISFLLALAAVAGFLLAPVVGRIIDRIGYKTVMVADTLILVVVCFFYGFAHHLFPRNVAYIVCCINYILDSVISLAAMASSVYVQDISDDPDEVRATLSTGISVNHMITILIALFGGWIWQTLGIETLFMLSALLGLINSAYAATIKTKKA